MMGFIGLFFDDGTNVVFDHSSGGATKAIHALSTVALQAVVAFGEIVHPVIELGSSSYDVANRTVHDPKLNVIGYVTDKRAREIDTLSDSDIITRPTASQRRATKEAPAH
jgi:ascorbate-specific PTS system EIIC-type component UlaA